MKIVQISSYKFPTPPIDYGGTPRDVHYLTNELIKMGHEVIVYAKKGSKTNGKLIEYPENCKSILSFVLKTLPDNVDIIHDHIGPIADAKLDIPTIFTSHTRSTKKNIRFPVYVSKAILKKQAKGIGDYVHNGILLDDYPFNEEKENYLLFLGRIREYKGTHHAIEVAKRTGIPLIIAGVVEKHQRKYFKKQIEPHIDNNLIKYVGPVGGEKKLDLLKNAKFVLFPITWFEPFGLVPIEAMACGTPAICFRKGGVKETMKGFPELVCNTVEEMVEIINKKDLPEPKKLRTYVERNFSAKMMTENYLKLYEKAIKEYKK